MGGFNNNYRKGGSSFRPKRRAEGMTKIYMKENRGTYQGNETVEFTGYLELPNGQGCVVSIKQKPSGGLVHEDLTSKKGEKIPPVVILHCTLLGRGEGGAR